MDLQVWEIFLYASKVFNDVSYETLARKIGMHGIEKYVIPTQPWPCIQTGEALGLMLGLAGVGHFYLRLYDSSKTLSSLIIIPNG
jgi:hypothetical protein